MHGKRVKHLVVRRWYDALGLHDPRMLSTSACSGCFCSKARVILHAISARCAQRATPTCYRLGTVDNSYAGKSSVRDRGQPAGIMRLFPHDFPARRPTFHFRSY